jgi:hypothetical protein
MRWIDTEQPDEASLQSHEFWANHREALQSDEFWADKIKELKEDPEARLDLALDNLPLPAAFREAAAALRALIRIERKEGSEWQSRLKRLYDLAAYESLMLDYAPRLQEPGYNVMESIPGRVVTELEFSYDTLGYRDLRLLNKTDAKWLVEAWGEPTRHSTLNATHKAVWDRFEDALMKRQKEHSGRLLDDLVALQRSSYSPPMPRTKDRKWWKFW